MQICHDPGHLRRVANIAAAGMEAHDNLDLQAQGLHKVKKLPIACPVIPLRLPLDCSPLHPAQLSCSRAQLRKEYCAWLENSLSYTPHSRVHSIQNFSKYLS